MGFGLGLFNLFLGLLFSLVLLFGIILKIVARICPYNWLDTSSLVEASRLSKVKS